MAIPLSMFLLVFAGFCVQSFDSPIIAAHLLRHKCLFAPSTGGPVVNKGNVAINHKGLCTGNKNNDVLIKEIIAGPNVVANGSRAGLPGVHAGTPDADIS